MSFLSISIYAKLSNAKLILFENPLYLWNSCFFYINPKRVIIYAHFVKHLAIFITFSVNESRTRKREKQGDILNMYIILSQATFAERDHDILSLIFQHQRISFLILISMRYIYIYIYIHTNNKFVTFLL